MNTPKTYAIIVLALTTLGGAVLGWQQYQELVELRAAAMNKDERADLQKRLWELEKLNKQLQDQLAALRSDNPDDLLAAGDRPAGDNRGARGGPGDIRGRGGRGNPQQQFEAIRGLLAKPEVQALLSVQQKAAIDARYAGLFKSLNLSPEQRAKFDSVLSDFQATRMDVLTAAQEQGVRDPAGIRQLMADAQNEFNNNLKSVLGEAGFAQYQNYEQTMPQRNLVNQLQQRLSYTDTPLTPTQADQLVNILAANQPPRPTNADGTPQVGRARGPDGGGAFPAPEPGGPPPGGRGGDMGVIGAVLGGGDMGGMIGATLGGGPGGGRGATVATVTPAAVSQAQGVLSQPQLAALQQVQQQQQTAQQLQQILRDTLAPGQPGNSRPNGGNAPGTGANPGDATRKRGGG